MVFVKTYGGAVKMLQSVAKGTQSRFWIRKIEYSMKSPKQKSRYTSRQIQHLKSMISKLKQRKSKSKKSRSRKSSKKYRPSPSSSATLYKIGTIKIENDRNNGK